MFSHCNKLSKKNIKTDYILNRNATLTPNSCDFYDLRTFVAKFCRRDLRTFSADFWRLEKRNPQTESLLECMILIAIYPFHNMIDCDFVPECHIKMILEHQI